MKTGFKTLTVAAGLTIITGIADAANCGAPFTDTAYGGTFADIAPSKKGVLQTSWNGANYDPLRLLAAPSKLGPGGAADRDLRFPGGSGTIYKGDEDAKNPELDTFLRTARDQGAQRLWFVTNTSNIYYLNMFGDAHTSGWGDASCLTDSYNLTNCRGYMANYAKNWATRIKQRLTYIPYAVTPADFSNSWNLGFKSVFTCSLKTNLTLSRQSSMASLKWQNVS